MDVKPHGSIPHERVLQRSREVLVFLAFISLVIALVGWEASSSRRRSAIRVGEPNEPVVVQAVDAVDRFHSEVKQERYQDICQAADSGAFLGDTSLPCQEFLVYIHKKLGDPLSARRVQLPSIGDHRQDGAVRVALDYETDYEHGAAREHFEWRIKGKAVILTSYDVVGGALSH
jgi:hypothetical protein